MQAWRWWELVFILKTKDLYIGGGKTETETSLEFNALLFPTYWSWPPDFWGIVAVRGTMQARTTSKPVSGSRAKSSRSRMLALEGDNIKFFDPHFSFIDVCSATFYTQ
jgi:hypothetical protein